jgi:hypothetical protein
VSSALSALVGAAAAAIFGALLGYFNYRRRRKRLLDIAALCCLDRLRKIEMACGGKLPKDEAALKKLPKKQQEVVRNEVTYLGGDLDRYLVSIGSVWPYERWRHFDLYGELRPILINHELAKIPRTASDLEVVAFEVSAFARRWGASVGWLRRAFLRPRFEGEGENRLAAGGPGASQLDQADQQRPERAEDA